MRRREALVALAIGIVVGVLAAIRYSTGTPAGFAVDLLFGNWWTGPLLWVAGSVLAHRFPVEPIARLIAVAGAAWTGFVLGVLPLFLLFTSMQRGY